VNSNGSNLSSLPAPPEITFGTGGPTGLVGAARVSDLLVRSAATPTAVPPAQTQTESQAQVVIGGNVQAAKLIRQERPMYPTLARQVRVQGVVTLEAIIGIDGTIQQLRVLGGHPLLVPSAIQAVQQWVYRPTILNGKVVEIKTTIEVRFTLSER
jgi:protein TonB